MNAQQQNEELQQRTEEALLAAKPHISPANYQLLCWHCGITPKWINLKQQEKENV